MAKTLKQQIIDIKESAVTNMFDTNAVQVAANERGYVELVCFIEEHRDNFRRFVITGDESLLVED